MEDAASSSGPRPAMHSTLAGSLRDFGSSPSRTLSGFGLCGSSRLSSVDPATVSSAFKALLLVAMAVQTLEEFLDRGLDAVELLVPESAAMRVPGARCTPFNATSS